MPAAFVGFPTFLRSRIVNENEPIDADIAVLGAPTDEGSPFLAGSRFAPRAIREQSMRFGSKHSGYYDPELERSFLDYEVSNERIVDLGDADVVPTDIVGSFDRITALTRRALDAGAVPIVLGGDHAISYPVVRAFDRPIHVVHLDAHADYAPFLHGLELTNGHAFRHIAHMDHVLSLTQVGIRGLRNPRVMIEDTIADGNALVTMAKYFEAGPHGIAAMVPVGAPVYISLDIDVLDMSLIPGCVSGEPNGMSYDQLFRVLAALVKRHEIAGLDLVEVNPQLDVGTGATSYLAAHTIVHFLGEMCDQQWWVERRSRPKAASLLQ